MTEQYTPSTSEVRELIAEARSRGWQNKLEGAQYVLKIRLADALESVRAERDDALTRISEAAKLHRPHRDTHKPDPSIIHPNWFCCGAMQLGVIGPMDCNHCRTEWPCPTAVALGLNEGERK